jgi:hypothetical protein
VGDGTCSLYTAMKEVCLTEGRGGLGEIHAHAVRQEDLITDLEQVVSRLYPAPLKRKDKKRDSKHMSSPLI